MDETSNPTSTDLTSLKADLLTLETDIEASLQRLYDDYGIEVTDLHRLNSTGQKIFEFEKKYGVEVDSIQWDGSQILLGVSLRSRTREED